MCVIFVSSKQRPSEEMIRKAYDHNGHGGGLAWRENGSVVWKKGLDLDQMLGYILQDRIPLPFVAHFRIASVGGIKPELTHPFPIMKNIPLELEGKTKGSVLFHNGHVGDWQALCLAKTLAMPVNMKVPDGPWSDSRGLAWLNLLHGSNINEFVKDQRVVVFGPERVAIYGSGWTQIENVWCSNDFFWSKKSDYYKSPWCKRTTCNRRDIDSTGFCPDHTEKRDAIVIDLDKSNETKTETGAGGGQSNIVPFQQRGPQQVAIPTLAEVQRWHQQGKISNNLFKKIRNAFLRMHNTNQKEATRGKDRLMLLVLQIPAAVRSSTGYVH
jgi:hypothetical protein